MAAPGFSITELIEAAVKTKHIYDSFFHKYENASNRVRNLCDTVNLFRINLENHQWLLEQSGRTYPGLDAFSRTLNECNEFIRKYERLLRESHETTSRTKDAIRRIGWTFEDRYIGNLTRQLQLHIQALNGFTLNLLLQNAMEKNHGTSSHYHSHSVNVQFSPSPELASRMSSLQVESSQQPQLSPPPSQAQLEGRPPQLRIENSQANELAHLWQEVQSYSYRQKRLRNQHLQSQRALAHAGPANRRQSMQVLATEELNRVIEKWKAIARNNGVDEHHLPIISAERPLETAEEFCKRLLQASEMASMPVSPLRSPMEETTSWLGPPQIRPRPPPPSEISIPPDTPTESFWTQRTSIKSSTPNSLIGQTQGNLEPLDLPPPGVLDCTVHLTLKHNTSTYPRLELKRVEVRQAPGSNEIVILCTTARNAQIQHRLPHGTNTHPYTKHKSLGKPFEVSFLEKHRIVHGNSTYTGDPTYTFFSEAECKAFQDSIRNKDLVHTFEVDKVAFKTSNALGEATDQHLKIWRDFDGGHFTITFFSNNPSDGRSRRHREFALSRLELSTQRRREGTMRLDFITGRRASLTGPSGPGQGLGLGDLSAMPMGSQLPSVEASPLIGTPTAPLSPRPESAQRSPEAGERSPPIGGQPRSSNSSRTRRQSSGQGLFRTSTVQTIGTSTTLDELESPISDEAAQAARLRFVEITFTDPADSDRFAALFPRIQHI